MDDVCVTDAALSSVADVTVDCIGESVEVVAARHDFATVIGYIIMVDVFHVDVSDVRSKLGVPSNLVFVSVNLSLLEFLSQLFGVCGCMVLDVLALMIASLLLDFFQLLLKLGKYFEFSFFLFRMISSVLHYSLHTLLCLYFSFSFLY